MLLKQKVKLSASQFNIIIFLVRIDKYLKLFRYVSILFRNWKKKIFQYIDLVPHPEAKVINLIEIPNESNEWCNKKRKHLNKSHFQTVHFMNQIKV